MTTGTNFLGIPIDGDIREQDKRTPQKPLSDLEPTIRAVLEDDGIDSFGWTQYTPYFNDGDPCVFGVGEPWFRTTTDTTGDEGDDYAFELSGHPTLGIERWDNATQRFVKITRDEETRARHDRCHAFATAIGSGAFDDVLLDAFGDHATVTVRRSGITVDEYSHD